jgi:hypothetical protein
LAASIFLIAFIEPTVLILGLELSIIALIVYYIKMVGYHRIRIAFGGMSLGLGAFTSFLAYLIGTKQIKLNGISPEATTAVFYVLIFASLIQILAGILNITTTSD